MSCRDNNGLVGHVLTLLSQGRTLEEMDIFFKDNHWIVPLAKDRTIDAGAREREFVDRKTMEGALDGEAEKADIAHV